MHDMHMIKGQTVEARQPRPQRFARCQSDDSQAWKRSDAGGPCLLQEGEVLRAGLRNVYNVVNLLFKYALPKPVFKLFSRLTASSSV